MKKKTETDNCGRPGCPGSDISDSSRLCGRRAFRKDDLHKRGGGAGAEDTVLDYNDIDQRIENYNTNYKQLNSTLVNSTQSLDAARELREGASDLMDESL